MFYASAVCTVYYYFTTTGKYYVAVSIFITGLMWHIGSIEKILVYYTLLKENIFLIGNLIENLNL